MYDRIRAKVGRTYHFLQAGDLEDLDRSVPARRASLNGDGLGEAAPIAAQCGRQRKAFGEQPFGRRPYAFKEVCIRIILGRLYREAASVRLAGQTDC